MNKVDIGEWGDFEIGSLFDIIKPPVLHARQVTEDEQGIPYVVRTKFNNGIKCRVIKTNNMSPSPKGVISFGSENATFFYQPEEFVSGRDIYYLDTRNVSELACQFLTACLQPIARKYSYNYGLFPELLKPEHIKLPVDAAGQPDWSYMDSFMQKVMNESKACLGNLRLAKGEKSKVDISTWKNFEIGSLFDIVKGTRLTKANMKPGDIRFIGSSAMNNGWTRSIKNDEHLHPANTLTVCYNGSVGETFYQDAPFWASDDVNVLYPKFKMNERIGMFIAPLIRAVGQRYAFVDKWRMEVMEHGEIKLPVDTEGIPNWAYMDLRMEAVLTQSKKSIDDLNEVNV